MKPRDRTRDLHLLATRVLNESRQHSSGEGWGWGLDDKRPFGNSGREGVGYDVLYTIGLTLPDVRALPEKDQEELIDYALDLYFVVASYICEVWQALPVPGKV